MNTAFQLVGVLLLILLFPLATVFIMFYIGWNYGGLWGWVSGVALFTPIIAYWYYRLSNRIRSYLDLLQSQTAPFRWDVEQSVNDLVALLKKQQKRKVD